MVDDNLADIVGLLTRAKASKKWDHTPQQIELGDGALGWRIFLKPQPEGIAPVLVAHPSYWIVESDDLDLAVFDGPTAVSLFRADTELVWHAAAPQVTVHEDRSAELVVRQPVSINGPWSYSVNLSGDDLTPDATVSVIKSEGPEVVGLVLGADVTLSLGELAPGEYTATVTVTCDHYDRASTSQPVTFTVTEPDPQLAP